MTALSLYLMGPFEGQIADEPLTQLRTDKVRALLTYLALEANQPHRRDSLAALLWPESPRRIALRNLRKTLHRLRSTLDAQAPLASERLFAIERHTIQLNAEALWLDAAQFEAQISTVEAHPHGTVAGCERCLAQLTETATLYRGELVAGLSLPDAPEWEEWLLIRREVLHHRGLELLDDLAAAYLLRRDFARALEYAQRQLALDPWREEAYRQAMRALAEQGQRSAALALYERCRGLLVNELGVEPDTETKAIYERLQHGTASVVKVRGDADERPRLHHFPAPLTPFVGRKAPLTQAVTTLSDPTCRVLTLHGPGGIGKTRLGLEVAARVATESDRFRDGIFFVPLASAATCEELVTTVLQNLGLEPSTIVPGEQQLANHLRPRHCLLVLDNFEQLLDDCTEVLLAWVRAAPGLVLLITSREPLRAQGEWVLPLAGLNVPTEGERAVGQSEAVQLFMQALRRVRPDADLTEAEVATIGHICRLVEGMPLALELAARWARVYELDAIAEEIAQGLDFLVTSARDVPERHRSMRVIFEQSWKRLSPAEREILAILSLFRGGFTAEAAHAVSGASLLDLASLVDQSLVARAGPHRFAMHELLRQFAAEKLSGQEEGRQHALAYYAAYYRTLLAENADALYGAAPRAALDRLQADLDNIRQAWDWSAEHGTPADIAPSVEGLARFFRLTGQLREGERRLRAAADRVAERLDGGSSQQEGDTLAHLLVSRAALQYQLDEVEDAARLSEQASHLAGDEGAIRGLISLMRANLASRNNAQEQAERDYVAALSQLSADQPAQWVEALLGLGRLQIAQGHMTEAEAYFRRGLAFAEKASYLSGVASMQRMVGDILLRQGQADGALRAFQRALVASRQSGDRVIRAQVMSSIANARLLQEKLDEAIEQYETALVLWREMGLTHGIAMMTGNIGVVHARAGHWEPALAALEEACRLTEQIGRLEMYANYRCTIAAIHRELGQVELARAGYEQVLAATERSEHHRNRLNALSGLGDVLKDEGDYTRAIGFYERAIDLERISNHRHHLCRTLTACAEAWYFMGVPERAEPLLDEAIKLATEFGWEPLVVQAEQMRREGASAAESPLVRDDTH